MILSKANIGTLTTSITIHAGGLFTGIATARALGPAARGELATVMLWPTIFSNLGLVGCNWAVAREVARDCEAEANWTCSALAVGLGSAILFVSSGYFLIPLFLPSDKTDLIALARLCLLMVPLDILSQILLAIEQGRMRWWRFNIARGSFFLFYVISIGSIWTNRRVQTSWFVWAFLTSLALTLVLRLFIQRKAFATGKLELAECRRLVSSGLPYFWATAGNLLALQFDSILVVTLMSIEAAGIYVVALALAGAQASLGEALGITSFALLSNEKSPGRQEKILTETFRQSALVSSAVGLLVACLIPFLVQPVFGLAFSRATGPAIILSIAASLTTSSGILNEGLRGTGRPYAGFASQLLGTAVMGLAALFLLQRFGLMGMAWAVLFGSCTQVAVLVAAASRWLSISPYRFWPFGATDVKAFCQQIAALRWRYLRSPA